MNKPQQDGGQHLVKMISPDDYRVYGVPASQRDAYVKAGYVEPTQHIDSKQIEEHFSGAWGAGKSFMFSTLAGVPFAKTVIAGVSDEQNAKWFQENFDAAAREHPVLDFAGHALGTVATVAAGGAAIRALDAGLGLGVAASEALGGAGAAGAGTAANAARAAGTAYKVGAQQLAGGQGLVDAAISGAITNTALGQIARIDDAALNHAADPAGKEKIVFDLNSTLLDAALGAALPVTLGGAGKALGYMGDKLGPRGQQMMRDAITKAHAADSVGRQGRTAELNVKLDEILASGRKNPWEFVKSKLSIAENDLENVKAALKYPNLNRADTDGLKSALRKTLGNNDKLYRKIADNLKKEVWTIDDMKEINKTIYDQIVFNEPTLRAAENARYMKAAEVIKNGTAKLIADLDPSPNGAMSQRWATAMKDFSEWSLAAAAVNKRVEIRSIKEVLTNIASGSATAGLAGGMFGAFGGTAAAAAGGAGYAGFKNITSLHYGQALKGLSSFFKATDTKLARAVEAGLYGLPAQMHNVYSEHRYEDLASKVSAAKANPEKSFQNLRTHLDTLKLPEDEANEIALTQHAQLQFLGSKLPGRMTGPDVASQGQPDPVQQRRFIGQVRTMQDPTYGLLYPTKTNMEVLQRFYPNLLFNAQQAIHSQLQRNPNMPAASKMWSSRVLGRPLNNLSSPTFSSMLQQARQAAAQQDQQGAAQRPGASRSSSSGGNSPQTRLDELQGSV